MTRDADVVALIQARGGSKGVPGKNLRPLAGHPLLAWSVVACRLAQSIPRTILSTDDAEIAEVGRRYGAEVPFMRPAEFATDTATDYPVIRHAVEWLRDNEGHTPEFVVQIRPTTPLRDPHVLDRAVAALKAAPDATGLRSVFEMPETAWKTFELKDGYLDSLATRLPGLGPEAANLPRQAFPATYMGQGYVDIVRSEIILGTEQTYGDRVLGFVSPDCGEVDVEDDFKRLEFMVEAHGRTVRDHLDANHPVEAHTAA